MPRPREYGVAEVTTAATFRTAALYQDFGKAMIDVAATRRGLKKAELEQYNVLLEEQAYPFEEKAIELHEVNAKRAAEGIYDDWVRNSFKALAELRPVRYGKNERSEGVDRCDPLNVIRPDRWCCSRLVALRRGCASLSEPLKAITRHGQPRRSRRTTRQGDAQGRGGDAGGLGARVPPWRRSPAVFDAPVAAGRTARLRRGARARSPPAARRMPSAASRR